MTDLPPADVAIFYHVYMHVDGDQNKRGPERSEQRAIKIIRQQLRHVADSLASIPNMKHVDLYYTTVGEKQGRDKVQEICQDHAKYFTCHHLQHVEEGFEEWTLGAMYEYCLDHEDQRVVYLHTKGSYHYSQSQDFWRQHLTNAALSSDCIQRAHAQGCELCGLMAIPQPTVHYTGNMFNAKCEYIRKLAHPKVFGAKLETFNQKGEELIRQGILVSSLLDMGLPCNTGSGRFAMEHWHGSHPSLQKVCDVSTHYKIEYWLGVDPQNVKPEDWHLAYFPRHPITADWSHSNAAKLPKILNDESARLREYFLLPGLLTKWYELYGEAPPQSSWVWSWYPDGQFWWRHVSKLGPKAVATVVNPPTEQEYEYKEEEEEEEDVVDEKEAKRVKATKEKKTKARKKEKKEQEVTIGMNATKETIGRNATKEMEGGATK